MDVEKNKKDPLNGANLNEIWQFGIVKKISISAFQQHQNDQNDQKDQKDRFKAIFWLVFFGWSFWHIIIVVHLKLLKNVQEPA